MSRARNKHRALIFFQHGVCAASHRLALRQKKLLPWIGEVSRSDGGVDRENVQSPGLYITLPLRGLPLSSEESFLSPPSTSRLAGTLDKPPKRLHNRKREATKRRELRKNLTPAEAALWKALKNRSLDGRRFRRQYSVGPFILDFYCPDENLAVELDGEVHNDPLRREYDDAREVFLQTQGIRVIRFENKEVFKDLDRLLQAIAWHFDKKTPPLDRGGVAQRRRG